MKSKEQCEENVKYLNKKLKRDEFIDFKKANKINNPKKIIFVKDLITDCNYNWGSNSLLLFTSIYHITYIIYSDDKKSIITYNLISNQKISHIKNAHEGEINAFKHCFDTKTKKDLIISNSKYNHEIKLWNFQKLQLLWIYKGEKVKCEFLLYNNLDNQFFLLTSSLLYEKINIYDLKGKLIKQLDSSEGETKYIDNYYDNDLSKNFVIVVYNNFAVSFDFNINKLYKIYYFQIMNSFKSLEIYKNEKTKLIISFDKYISIWDFHSGNFENNILVCNRILRSVCPWNEKYFFTGSTTIRLVDINKNKIKKLSEKVGVISSIKKCIHPQFGECLITKNNSNIKLWRIEK